MDKIYREAADIRVAFKAALNRKSSNIEQVVNETSDPDPDLGDTMTNSVAFSTMKAGSKTKRFLRPFASAFFRLLKPVASPIAFRIRRYLLDDLRQRIGDLHPQLDRIERDLQNISPQIDRIERGVQNFSLDRIERDLPNISAQIDRIERDLQNISPQIDRVERGLQNFSLDRIERGLQNISPQIDRIERGVQNFSLDRIERDLPNISAQIDRIEEFSSLSVRRIAVNCGPDDILIKTVVGYVLCASKDPALVGILLEAGELEPGTRLLIERIVRSGDTFVDVGANIGLHTLAAARAMRGVGKIIAFEPYNPTFERLKKTIWFNGFSGLVDVRQCAVSDHHGTQQLHLGPTSGHHSLFDLGAEEGAGGEAVEVRLVTIDEIVEPGSRVNLIKIDAEGAEIQVLHGALKTIEANPELGLIVEFGPSHLERTGQTAQGWLTAFTNLGFQYRAIHHLNGTLEVTSLEKIKATESANLLFARPQSYLWQGI